MSGLGFGLPLSFLFALFESGERSRRSDKVSEVKQRFSLVVG